MVDVNIEERIQANQRGTKGNEDSYSINEKGARIRDH